MLYDIYELNAACQMLKYQTMGVLGKRYCSRSVQKYTEAKHNFTLYAHTSV